MSQEQRVLMLVNTHVYDDPRVVAEGVALVKHGYQVTVIGAARLGGVATRGTLDGMDVTLSPMVTTRHPLRLLVAVWHLLRGNVGSVTHKPPSMQTNIISFIFFILWAIRLGWKSPAVVIHAHDLSPLPAAWLLARWHRARLVYDSHESAADFYPGRKGQLMAWLERRLIGKADRVITVGDKLAADLRVRGAKHVTVIGNWKRLELFSIDPSRLETERQRLGLAAYSLVIVFIGDLTPTVYELRPLLTAVSQSPQVALLIGGRGGLQEEIQQMAEQASNIFWFGYVNYADVPLYTTLADIVYCCISPDFLQSRYVVPNKLFEAFAAGRPLFAHRGVGEIGDMLEKIPAAVILDEVTAERLKDAFQHLEDPDLRQNLHHAALQGRELYHWQVAETRLLELYQSLTPYNR
ncbi:MAG: glycosyltransferase [Anaerolineaceae bacterium]|nr:glycosyltransferase [Anaerolineaceae bacterium]